MAASRAAERSFARPRRREQLRLPANRTFSERVPDRLKRATLTLARQFFGLGLVLLALAGVAALITFNSGDPSFNTATAREPLNALGLAGAYVSDIALQTIGLGALAFLVPPAVWGFALMAGNLIRRLWLRVILLPVAATILAVAFAAWPAPDSWPFKTGLGGVIGETFYAIAEARSGEAGGIPLIPLVALMLHALAIGLVLLASGVTPAGAAKLARWAAVPFVTLVSLLARIRLPKIRLRRERSEDDADLDEDEDDDPEIAIPTPTPRLRAVRDNEIVPERVVPELEAKKAPKIDTRIVRPTAAPPKKGKRARAEEQPVLALEKGAGYQLPALSYLSKPRVVETPRESNEALEANARLLESVLSDFGVRGTITQVNPGPVVTLYELEPAAGIKASRVIGLADDIARSMSAISARVAVVSGRNVIGIELPNRRRETVYLRELLSSPEYESNQHHLTLALGKDISGAPVFADLARMPHLLIAGTTGSGKSVAINTMILSFLYRMTPQQCRMIMIDPKMLELSVYDAIPHLLTPVVTEPKKAIVALKWAVREMEDRYRKMSKLGVRNIDGYNERVAKAKAKGEVLKRVVQTGFNRETGEPIYEEERLDLEAMPFIVIVIDEMADLMIVAGKDIEALVQRLAQMARAAGIHLIMATQRPSVDVITGTIKANFPTRISFQVTSKIDSRTILGEQGAEQLLGQGDMLYMAGGGRIRRVHGPFVSDEEVEEVVKYLKTQGRPEYLDAVTEDPDDQEEDPFGLGTNEGGESDDLYDKAVAIVLRERKATTSYIQRRLQIGYNRAARIIERMEEEGVLGSPNHQGKREILVPERD